MSLSSALFAGVSGLNTLGNSMSVIGDNIANINTIGFKGARTTFETVLAQNIAGASGTSQVGRGVALSAVDPIFSQGSFESTNEPTDMAIGGKGFFMVRSPQTGMYYTRAGHFRFDEEGYLVNPADLRVQGWILQPDESDPRGAITDIQINATSSAPQASQEIDIAVNLDTDELFIETAATVESDPATSSGFVFEDGVSDSFVFNDGGGLQTIDLISTSNDYFDEGEVYTGAEVASTIQQVLEDNSTNSYTVTYSNTDNTFTISNPSAVNTLIIDDASTMEGVLGLTTTADTTIAVSDSTTGSEVAYNVTSVNSSFVISVDGGNDVTVSLTNGIYTITSLRVELEDKINEALASDGQSVTVDVRYDFSNNRYQISSSTRGGKDSRIQLSALTGTSNNFLPSINMTDYTEHLGEASNGYTLPGFTESSETNKTGFIFRTSNSIIQLTDTTGTNRTVSLLGQTSSTYGTSTANTIYTGEAVAEFLDLALGAANYTVTYDNVTDRFTIQNDNATTAQIFWTNANTTAEATLGFSVDDTIAQNDSVTGDTGVAFNILASQNDQLDIIVDGNPENSGTAVTVTISAGAYSGDSLATELENKINTALAAEGESVTVKVTYNETTGRMRIASSTLGPDSSIQLGTTGMGAAELLGGTLDIDDDTINYGMGFQVAKPDDSTNYSTSIVVYDSLGNQHSLTFYLRKAAIAADGQSTTWEWFAYVPPSETASGEAEVQARGTLTFNEQGILTGQSPTQWLTTLADGTEGEGFDFGSGAEPQQDIDIDFGLNSNVNLSTQYASPSSTIFQSQDGFGSGFLQDVSVDPDGVVSGNYSNGQVLYLARVALANFTNPWGLSRVGGNVWAETRRSGQPLTGTPGSAGLGKLSPNSLEQSNVDLSAEFVNMIIQQRGFQANSRIITTTDAMLGELLNLKR